MELKTEELTAAQQGQHVKILANGHTFYLLSQKVYEKLEEVDYDAMTKEEVDLLADETHAVICDGETDEY